MINWLGLKNSYFDLKSSLSHSDGQKMSYKEGADNAQIVIKEFKFIGSGRDRRADYIEIMETQCVAAFMAMEFNKLARIGLKRINFISLNYRNLLKIQKSTTCFR